MTAYEDLKKEIKGTLGDDPLFAEYGKHTDCLENIQLYNYYLYYYLSNHPTFLISSAPWISKMTGDAHPGALDAGLDAALMFIDADPSNSFKSSVEKVCILYFSYVSIDFFHIMFHIFIRYVLQ